MFYYSRGLHKPLTTKSSHELSVDDLSATVPVINFNRKEVQSSVLTPGDKIPYLLVKIPNNSVTKPPRRRLLSEVCQSTVTETLNRTEYQVGIEEPCISQFASNENDEGFSVVAYKTSTPKPKPRPPVIYGRRKQAGVKSVQPVRHLFITRFPASYSTCDMSSYIQSVSSIDVTACLKVKSKFNSWSSFKVSVRCDEYDVLLNPDVWPENCLIREWKEHRPKASSVDRVRSAHNV